MTIKEKLETIKGKKIAIWCEEEWMAEKLYEANKEDSMECYWTNYYCCIDLEDVHFSHCYLSWYENEGYDVIKFEDFIDDVHEEIKTFITQQDINTILNDKYGKDNWVIK